MQQSTTNAIVKKLGPKNGLSQISTQGIVCKINDLHYEKKSVANIDDGINDVSALTLDDIEIAELSICCSHACGMYNSFE